MLAVRRIAATLAIIVGLSAGGHAAAQTAFCQILLREGGQVTASVTGERLSSAIPGGMSSRVEVDAVGNFTVRVDPPVLVQAPGPYNTTGQSLEVAYRGLGGLSGVNQSFTQSSTSFNTGLSIIADVLIDARLNTPVGLTEGNYRMRTVLTCF
ncbi:MAG: hypothetical protein AAF371_11500 [Pseudomonadota bacterium]